jgi:hypothetical protein
MRVDRFMRVERFMRVDRLCGLIVLCGSIVSHALIASHALPGGAFGHHFSLNYFRIREQSDPNPIAGS